LQKVRRKLLIEILRNVKWDQLGRDELPHLIAYGKMKREEWEVLLTKKWNCSQMEQLNHLLGCLLLSAVNASQEDVTSPSFNLVHDWVNLENDTESFMAQISKALFKSISKEDLSTLARIKTESPVLLSDLPSLREIFLHPLRRLLKRQETSIEEEHVLRKILEDIFYWSRRSISSSSVDALETFRRFLSGDLGKRVMDDWDLMEEFTCSSTELWAKNVEIGKEFVKKGIQIYIDFFGVEWEVEENDYGELSTLFREHWLIEHLVELIPVQLLVIGEEQGAGRDQKWDAIVNHVQMRTRERFQDCFSLWKSWELSSKYNRQSDWYRLYCEVPELRDKIPEDFQEKTGFHLTWQCSLLRVWMNIFGINDIMSQEDSATFFQSAATEMRDGELLHIAVELGSLDAVKATAWPGFIYWRNGDKTALELSLEKWGEDHEISEFLQAQTKQLVESGFLKELKVSPEIFWPLLNGPFLFISG